MVADTLASAQTSNGATSNQDVTALPNPTVRPGTDLDYVKLLRFLSSPNQLPCSLLFRNVLMHPFVSDAARDIEAGTVEDGETNAALLAATWEDYSSSMPRCQISAIGEVPQELFAEDRPDSNPVASNGLSQENQHGDSTSDKPWALLRIASSRSRQGAPGDTKDEEAKSGTGEIGPGDRINILLWLSSEKQLNRQGVGAIGSNLTLSQSAAKGDALAQQSLALLRYVLATFIPDTFRKHCAERLDTATGGYQSMLAGVNGLIADELASMAGEPGLAPVRTIFKAPCTLFLAAIPEANESRRLVVHEGTIDGRWMVDTVKESDLSLVSEPKATFLHASSDSLSQMQSRNHIAYPLGYMRHCGQVSVLLRDLQVSDPASGSSKVVGWCMMHENGALAMLWLEKEYRGVRTASQRSLGDALTALTAEKIARAHRLALERLSMADLTRAATLKGQNRALADPAAVIATTEHDNPLGLRFFERCGYAAADGPVTWMGVTYHNN